MIKVEAIRIKDFRGIRDLSLNFRGKNFAICGPNGTGKSGVVDALEFVLTGRISRLSGEGSGDISLARHGPHVDVKDNPEKARVTASVTIPSQNITVSIARSLKRPNQLEVIPADPGAIDVLKQVEAHPEFVLSRRELIRYVLATPGKRSEEVQALLKLDQVERVRVGLQKISNSDARKLPPINSAVAQAQENLLRAIGLPNWSNANVLAAVNIQREILGLPGIEELTKTTSLKDGMASAGTPRARGIPKIQALADIQAVKDTLTQFSGQDITNSLADATTYLVQLRDDPVVNAKIGLESFLARGIDLIDTEMCPFCDTRWEMEELRRHIQGKIDNLQDAKKKRETAELRIAPLISAVNKIEFAIKPLISYAGIASPPVDADKAKTYIATCEANAKRMATLFPIDETISVLSDSVAVPQAVVAFVDDLETVVNDLPELSKQDGAKEYLTVAQERLEVFRDAKRRQSIAESQAEITKKISDTYTRTSDAVLTGIYQSVERDFADNYREINSDDEYGFKAKLIPSLGKLGFDVEFYGRGFFPPGAYHSEGHQDAMGLCLYLALMRALQGDAFGFSVLDDVLMSVDAGHRREVCNLLKSKFPDTQLIFTTHDPVWLRHMKTENLIERRAAIQFINWTVEEGPTRWDDRDVWKEIEDYLTANDVRAAAALLRHFLEYTAAELCHRLRAPVEYRGDGRYQLGELLPAATLRMKELFKKAKNAANSWNQGSELKRIAADYDEFCQLVEASRVEDWQVNVAVHYNSWENLNKNDFAPAVEAVRQLLDGFSCNECAGYIRVLPDRETAEMIRCDCAKTNINLVQKGK